ncbi:Acyl-CoA-binding domain-containing protein 3, partial [Cucurbita argyrosperma subsp. argyrosperma]
KFLSRDSAGEELSPFGFDFGFGSRIHNLKSDKPSVVVEDFVGGDEISKCETKQGNSTGIFESRGEAGSKCDDAVTDSVRVVEGEESDSDNGGGEVAEKVFDESADRASGEERTYRGEENVRDGVEVEEFESDRSKKSGGVNKEGSAEVISVEDDDWVGIDRTELEKEFEAVVKFVKIHDTEDPNFGDELKMRLSGLHKIAMEGCCREPPPLALKISARSKCSTDLMNGFYLLILSSKAFVRFVKLDSRNAWKQLGNMTPEVAMERYINLVSENIPGWTSKAPPLQEI